MQGICLGLRLPALQTQGDWERSKSMSFSSPGGSSGTGAGQRCPPALSPGQRRLADRARLSWEQNFRKGYTESYMLADLDIFYQYIYRAISISQNYMHSMNVSTVICILLHIHSPVQVNIYTCSTQKHLYTHNAFLPLFLVVDISTWDKQYSN